MPPPKPNLRSTAIKRILQEHKEFTLDPSQDFVACPLEDDLFDWHVTLKGASGGDYDGGIYHLRLLLPPTYPLTPPDIQILTPSGRFETQKNICIDGITSFHTGSWRPVWGIRTVVVGLGGFWEQDGKEAVGGYGGLNCSKEERRRLAGISKSYTCPTCQQSNEEIMKVHEETVKMAKRVKEDENKGRVDEQASGFEVKEADGAKTGLEATLEDKVKGREKEPELEVRKVDTRIDNSQIEEKESSQITRPPLPLQPTPATRPASFLLHPSLSHPLIPAPLKLYIHIVRLLLIPAPLLRAHRLPETMDWILVLDTAIWVVGILVVVIVGGKVGRMVGRLVGWGGGGSGMGRNIVKAGGVVGAGTGLIPPRLAPGPDGQVNFRRPRNPTIPRPGHPDQGVQNHVHVRRYGGGPAARPAGQHQPQQAQAQGQQAGAGVTPQPPVVGESGTAHPHPTREPGLAGPLTTGGTGVEAALPPPRDDPAAVRRARAVAEERTQGV